MPLQMQESSGVVVESPAGAEELAGAEEIRCAEAIAGAMAIASVGCNIQTIIVIIKHL